MHITKFRTLLMPWSHQASPANLHPYLVLVVRIAVAEVSYKSDEVCLKADDRRIGGSV